MAEEKNPLKSYMPPDGTNVLNPGARHPNLQPFDDVFQGQDTVTMSFPRQVNLRMDDHRVVEFRPGVQEVPATLADHPYLKHNGVTRYEAPGKKGAKDAPPDWNEEQTKLIEEAKAMSDFDEQLNVVELLLDVYPTEGDAIRKAIWPTEEALSPTQKGLITKAIKQAGK